MDTVEIGTSGIRSTVIAFGAWAIGGWMWGGADEKDAEKAIHKSLDLGITTFDTAAVYGFGKSESLLGKALKGQRDRVRIFTKYGLRWDTKKGKYYFPTKDHEGKPIALHKYAAKDSVIRECEDSLSRLKTDYIDLYQIHWPDPTTPIHETMEAVGHLIRQGKVRAAGVSNYSLEEMKEAGETLTIHSNQVPYSMLRRDIEKDLVPYCMENNKSILAYSPMQRGFLTGKFRPGHEFNEGDSRASTLYAKEENLKKINRFLEEIRPLANDHEATLPQLVIRWTMQRPGITVVLAGARNPRQVSENAGAAKFVLSDDEMQMINDRLEKLTIT